MKNVFFGILLIVIVVLIIAGDLGTTKMEVNKFSIPNSQEEIIARCNNLNLTETANCFYLNIKTFFKYSKVQPVYEIYEGEYRLISRDENGMLISPVNITLIEYLKENGGLCREWSLLYFELCSKTNFKCEQLHNEGISNVFSSHVYSVMYDDEQYCKLDQLNVKCYPIKK